MQWIGGNLFVGNKLATAEIVTRDGIRIDLRSIRSPIICFCSQGDDITPPQQALGWIPGLYETVADIRANGQTIVYCVHGDIGHLGIFVLGSVAKKEHQEFASNIDFIDCLPPGLYEAVITPVDQAEQDDKRLAVGGFVLRLEHRSIDAIRALGGNDLEDERKFAAVSRLSDVNLGLYRTLLQPWLRSIVTEQSARDAAAAQPVAAARRTALGRINGPAAAGRRSMGPSHPHRRRRTGDAKACRPQAHRWRQGGGRLTLGAARWVTTVAKVSPSAFNEAKAARRAMAPSPILPTVLKPTDGAGGKTGPQSQQEVATVKHACGIADAIKLIPDPATRARCAGRARPRPVA